jgi:hypothetical protein
MLMELIVGSGFIVVCVYLHFIKIILDHSMHISGQVAREIEGIHNRLPPLSYWK